MINKYKIITNRILMALNRYEQTQQARLKEIKEYGAFSLKFDKHPNGKGYYYIAPRGKGKRRPYKYLGTEANNTVRIIKEVRYLQRSLKVIARDKKLLEKVMREVEGVDYDSINQMLPATYRGAVLKGQLSKDQRAARWKKQAEANKQKWPPSHPEELIIPTDDGTMVRSKSEALIYNLLLRMGITFVYEMPVRTKTRIRHPDFALLSEVDYKTVILIEHQGKMNDQLYSEKFNDRVYDYLQSGYVSGINIYYTFDGADGSINMDPILDIIKLKIRPDIRF